MRDKVLEYRRGDLIAFESGSFSNYSFDGMLVALEDLDLKKEAQAYVREHAGDGEQKEEWDSDYEGFLGWLVSRGKAAPVDYSLVYLGDGGSFDETFGIEKA